MHWRLFFDLVPSENGQLRQRTETSLLLTIWQDFQAGVQPRGAKRARKPTLKDIEEAPQGLVTTQLEDQELVQRAAEEVMHLMSTKCRDQIASNKVCKYSGSLTNDLQHFFINLPFPLGGFREDFTPLFPYDSPAGTIYIQHEQLTTLQWRH